VKVDSVRTANFVGRRRRGKLPGTVLRKKAYVRLKAGENAQRIFKKTASSFDVVTTGLLGQRDSAAKAESLVRKEFKD
jgi:hypothetical protein